MFSRLADPGGLPPRLIRFLVLLLALTLYLTVCGRVQASTVTARCASYSQEVRRAHAFYFGVDFPWWYSVAQLRKESACRDVISRDGIGSEGAAQITYRWWKDALEKQGIPEVRTRSNHLRAQAFINYDAWTRARRGGAPKLWVAYQIYNGGTLVLTEIKRAGAVDPAAARAHCRRKNITFNNGQTINACDINYDYSPRIETYAKPFRTGPDSPAYPFW